VEETFDQAMNNGLDYTTNYTFDLAGNRLTKAVDKESDSDIDEQTPYQSDRRLKGGINVINILLFSLLVVGGLVVTLLSLGLMVVQLLEFAIKRGVALPLIANISAASCTSVLLQMISTKLPPAIAVVVVPMMVGAIVSLPLCKTSYWQLPALSPNAGTVPPVNMAILIGAISCGVLLASSNAGKTVLNALGQDVVGKSTAEQFEIRFTGFALGVLIGGVTAATTWGVVMRMKAGD